MRHAARVTMSMRELDRLKCIQAVVDGELYPGIATERLGISTRQLRRIAQRYRGDTLSHMYFPTTAIVSSLRDGGWRL